MDRLMSEDRRPPVVKASRPSSDFYLDERLFERVLGVPDKIHIPERYIPEEEYIEPEEELRRSRKAEAICRLLAKSGGSTQSYLPQLAQESSQRKAQLKVKETNSWSSSGVWSGTSSRHSLSSPQSLPVSPLRRSLPVARKPSDPALHKSSNPHYHSSRTGNSYYSARDVHDYWEDRYLDRKHLVPETVVDHHDRHSSQSSTSSTSSDREDFIHLQHVLAREVTQRSRLLALRALNTSPRQVPLYNPPSPPSPIRLPTVQQRDGFFT